MIESGSLSIEAGPLAAWAGAAATLFVALVALTASFGVFERTARPRLRITFQPQEPWCRTAELPDGRRVLWVRLGVQNVGGRSARGCVGRMTALATGGIRRHDVDPLQLRWAGMPRAKAFDAIDLRPGQREFLNVLVLDSSKPWRIVTFEEPDFDPGFTTELDLRQQHRVYVSVFADNVTTLPRSLGASCAEDGSVALYLL